MASNYKTPGVYVEEITKFPPSVAAVETAIPAFIGYTERATQKIDGDLLGKPTKITAIAEYERYFGGPEQEITFVAEIKDTYDENSGRLLRQIRVPEPDNLSPFKMSYAMQLYFANGGGPCYIISVGNYDDDIDSAALGNNTSGNGGLDLLEKEDEPTLIVFPDAQDLNDGDFYTLYQAALAQCNKLQDRFAIMDTKGTEPTAPTLYRNGIGTNFLKYGAVYFPFLETTLNYNYEEEDVEIEHTKSAIFNVPDVQALAQNSIDINVPAVAAFDNPAAFIVAITGALGNGTNLRAALTALKTGLTSVGGSINSISSAVDDVLDAADGFNVVFNDAEIELAVLNLETFDENIVGAAMIYASIDAEVDVLLLLDNVALDTIVAGDITDITDVFTATTTALKTTVAGSADPTEPGFANLISQLETAVNANDPDVFTDAVNDSILQAHSAQLAIEAIDETASLQDRLNEMIAQLGALNNAATSIVNDSKDIANVPVLNSTLSDTIAALDLSKLSDTATNNGFLQQFEAMNTDLGGGGDAAVIAITFQSTYTALNGFLSQVFDALLKIQQGINYFDLDELSLEDIENVDNESYNAIKLEIDLLGVKLPPSSGMAGIYAQVDRDRGVWKAPANLSMSAVVKPVLKITNDFQDGLNVDVVAGKSVNAIRAFAGKGTMVWGARTLAGNDNEWRYISVRRFFNFVEESVKKATEQFVFEPNDANTWVRIKAMIENFLTLQWRAGALAGAKPDHAFYVRVGIGETMTAVDILEGRMIVEIGMAVVRPAEFIILRFSHKMQES